MPIILTLNGQLNLSPDRMTRSEARDWLAKAAVWFEGVGDAVLDAHAVRDTEDKPVLLVSLHPAAQPIEIRLGASGKIRLTAATTPVGPGYHQYLCDLARMFAGDFDILWDETASSDPTGFLTSADRFACEQQFLNWLSPICSAAAGHSGESPVHVGLSPTLGFTGPGPVLTPLGTRSRDWLASVATDPERGKDFFPWWNPEADAEFYANRALVRLWCDFPWREPLTEEEGELTDQIANDLATAYKLDPAAELPWKEWLEVLDAIERDEEEYTVTPTDLALTEAVIQRSAEMAPSDPPIGYLRWPVRVTLSGGWSIEVPGEFVREWNDDRTWTGWDATRTVWFHTVGFTKPDGSLPTSTETIALGRKSLPDGTPVPGVNRDGIHGEAVFGEAEEDGRRMWRLSGVTAAEGQLAVCHVYTEDADDRDWAIQAWHSLKHAK